MKTTQTSIFDAKCRYGYADGDISFVEGQLYTVKTHDFNTFTIIIDEENNNYYDLDIRALAAYFCFYPEDAEYLHNLVSHDEYTYEKTEDGMEYFEEY